MKMSTATDSKCPKCSAPNIAACEAERAGEGALSQVSSCGGCGAVWRALYHLVAIEEFEERLEKFEEAAGPSDSGRAELSGLRAATAAGAHAAEEREVLDRSSERAHAALEATMRIERLKEMARPFRDNMKRSAQEARTATLEEGSTVPLQPLDHAELVVLRAATAARRLCGLQHQLEELTAQARARIEAQALVDDCAQRSDGVGGTGRGGNSPDHHALDVAERMVQPLTAAARLHRGGTGGEGEVR